MADKRISTWAIGAFLVLLICGMVWLGVHLATQLPTKSYQLSGKVVAVHLENGTVTIYNDNMPGLMAPMDMDYRIKDKNVMSNLKPGDVIHATLKTDGQSFWELQNVTFQQSP